MNLNFNKIISIIFASIIVSLLYNHFSSNGLDLIRNEKVLAWENESLNSTNDVNTLLDNYNSPKNQNSSNSTDSLILSQKISEKEFFKGPKAIKIDLAFELFNKGIQFIDSRSPEEYAEGHIKGAINVPFYGSENYLNIINKFNKDDYIVTYCSSAECDVSTLSGDELFKMGFKKTYVYVGGYAEWTKFQYPINKKD